MTLFLWTNKYPWIEDSGRTRYAPLGSMKSPLTVLLTLNYVYQGSCCGPYSFFSKQIHVLPVLARTHIMT